MFLVEYFSNLRLKLSQKNTNSMMAFKNYFCSIYGTKWFGVWLRQDQGLKASGWVEHLHSRTSLEGPPWDDVYVTIFTYFASIEVGLYFHTGALSNWTC